MLWKDLQGRTFSLESCEKDSNGGLSPWILWNKEFQWRAYSLEFYVLAIAF